jgi:hypothetical protein
MPTAVGCTAFLCIKMKGKVHPITGLAGTEGEYRYTFTLSLTLGLDDVSG